MTETVIKTRNWYSISKPAPDGRLNTYGFEIKDGQKLLTYARTADDVARIRGIQEHGYIVEHEIRNKKAKAGSEA